MDKLGLSASRIAMEEDAGPSIRIDDLHVAAPTGSIKLSEMHVELKPGEHVLIVGEHGAGKTLLFRALVGLWPWGSGRIARPPRQSVVFVPTHPYVPPGVLRAGSPIPIPPASTRMGPSPRRSPTSG